MKLPANSFDVVIYHAPCYDGFTAAWVAWRNSPNAIFVPATHGDEPPDVKGKRVLIVDFGYPMAMMEKMFSEATSLVLLDHHKTTHDALSSLTASKQVGECECDILFDMQRSGAGITWDYVIGTERPQLINYVEDRDLWAFQYPETKAFHAGLSTIPWAFDAWENATNSVQRVLDTGKTILEFQHKIASEIATKAARIRLGDSDVIAVNVSPQYVGEVADILYTVHPSCVVLGWHWDGERGDFYCSLRSHAEGPDVSELAKRHGGGGHPHAAGFRTQNCPVG